MFRIVQERVEQLVAERGEYRVRTDRAVCLDITNRRIDGYCYLFFEPGRADNPLLVAKAAATPAGKEIFRADHKNLEVLDRIGMNATTPTTPLALGLWEEGETLVTVQTALPGTLMKNLRGRELFSRTNAAENLGRVHDWWSDLQRRFGVRRTVLSGDPYDRLLSEVHRFRRRYLLSAEEERYLTRRFEQERPLEGAELPYMARHADFCAANMVLDGSRLGVFDWEFPLTHESPLFDPFFFYSSVRFPYPGLRAESSHFDSFVAVYWEDSYFSREVRRLLGAACSEFGIAPELTGDLLLLSLIQVANLKYQGLVDSHGIAEDDLSPAGDDEKRARWAAFDTQSKNVPFARIDEGRLVNLSHIVAHGLPDLSR